MKENNSYFTLVCFVGIRLYSVEAGGKRQAAEEGIKKIIDAKYRSGRFFKYDDFPILVAVQENPGSKKGPVVTLYRTEIEENKREDIKEVEALEEIEPFLRSAFRMIRKDIKDIDDFKKNIETIMKIMVEEMKLGRRQWNFSR